MSKDQTKKSARFLFILNGMLFLLGAFSLIEEEKYVQASVQATAGLINLVMLARMRSSQWQLKGHLSIFLMNIIVCLMVAYDLHVSGKTYIQFVWLLSAILSMVAMIVFYRRQRSAE